MMPRLPLVCLALTALAAPVAWAEAETVQVIRRAVWGDRPDGIIPYTTYEAEQQAITRGLTCKWMSSGGRLGPSYGNSRYDFLCKGGDWATVALYLDRAAPDPTGVGRVRLFYRDWKPAVQPTAGEAYVAQAFVQHVLARFVPPRLTPEMATAFWGGDSRTWKTDHLTITYTLEPYGDFVVRKLEIAGKDKTLATLGAPVAPVVAPVARVEAPVAVPVATPKPAPVAVAPVAPVRPVVLPIPTGAPLPDQPMAAGLTPAAYIAGQPAVGPVALAPAEDTARRTGLLVPDNAPAGSLGKGALPQATAAELNTAPAPESKMAPAPLQAVSATLVPDPEALVTGRTKAPPQFDIYNKATALTAAEEKRANILGGNKDKVVDAREMTGVSGTAVPALPPVPTPVVVSQSMAATGGLAVAPSESAPAPVADPAPETAAPRRDYRPLPQLKFIPRAEPVANPAEVIKFEDEKSSL